MRKQFEWLWKNMDAPFRRRHVIALCVCAFTCLLLLVNPALSRRLIDDVIMAGNPEPLLSILAVMLAVKLGREGRRYPRACQIRLPGRRPPGQHFRFRNPERG